MDYSNGNPSLLAQLEVAARPDDSLAKLDYAGQIERWNKYQNILSKIDEKCMQTKGDVTLRKNVKHNMRMLDDVAISLLSVIGLTALLVIVGGMINDNNIYAIGGSIAALGFVGWQILFRLHPPSTVHFTCRPALHVEEYAYMNKHIKGIPRVTRDPVVTLPGIEMRIPRSWLAQQGMLEFMESLKDIKLDMND